MIKIYNMDVMKALKKMPDKSVDMQITSPPYWALRDYGVEGQLGLEPTFDEYINKLCDIFDEVKRVLKDDGTCWVNLGDTFYGGGNNRGNKKTISKKQASNKGAIGQVQMNWDLSKYKSKCLCMIPERFAIEMISRGWILRSKIIWHKPNAMPSSVKDRFNVDYEVLYQFSKKKKYYFEQQLEPIKNETIERNKYGHCGDGVTTVGRKRKAGEFATKQGNKLMRNKRCVWRINTTSFSAKKYGFKDIDHFATFPKALVRTPILTTPIEICEKCGKAKSPIYTPSKEYAKKLKQSWTEDTDKDKNLRMEIGFKANTKKHSCCPDYKVSFKSSCNCNAGFKPSIIMDIFAGKGTTLEVARDLGRDSIGIEINPDYVEIAKAVLTHDKKGNRNLHPEPEVIK